MYRSTRALIAAVALGCLMATVVAAPTSADSKDDIKRERRSVSGKISGAKKQYEQSSKQYAAAAEKLSKATKKLKNAKSSLSSTRSELDTAKAKDARMQAKLVQTEARLSDAKSRLADGKKNVSTATNLVREYTLNQLQEGDRGLRAFGDLLRGQNPMVFSQKLNLNASVSDAQLSKMQELEATRVMLKVRRDEVEDLRDKVADQRAEAAANLEQMEKLEKQAEEYADEVDTLVGKRKSAEKEAASEKAADARKLQALEDDRARLNRKLSALAQKEARKAARQRRSSGGSSGTPRRSGGGGGGSAGGDGGSTLSRPLRSAAPITSPYGMRFHPTQHVYKLHDGTDFGVGCGTGVYASASGKVIDTYFNAGYGNRVVINHGTMRGKNVVTTYNHLSRFAVSSGQHVRRGQLIAYSGTTGYSTGCHLHFMVIVNGSTTNPMGWL